VAGVAVVPPASVAAVEPAVDTLPPPALALRRAPADERMRRVLRLDGTEGTATDASARSALERSLLISMVRCLLTYIVLPFVAPVLGAAADVTPWVGLLVGAVAIVFNVASIRRFWRADHRYRWHYTALSVVVIVLLVWLVVSDLADLVA